MRKYLFLNADVSIFIQVSRLIILVFFVGFKSPFHMVLLWRQELCIYFSISLFSCVGTIITIFVAMSSPNYSLSIHEKKSFFGLPENKNNKSIECKSF